MSTLTPAVVVMGLMRFGPPEKQGFVIYNP